MHSTLKNFFNENNKNISFNNFNNYFFDVNQNMDNYLLNVTSAKSVNLQNKLTDGDILSSVEDFNLLKNCNNFMHLDEKSFDKQSYEYLFSKFPETQALLLSKLYIPKPFNASPSNVYNGLPWFLDFVHLSFWFFFLSIVVSVLFLIYFFNFIWNNQENKYPIRETRGFSRAQTGDTMTAIIPMTWSITMLLHASTHSSNFDENTTGTQFCLTVIAYQWGWNYYYPKDIIGIFNSTPIKVGHDNVDYYSNFNDNYATLLDISRNQILNKNFYLGVGSSKVGKSNIQTLQSLFFKPFGSNQNLELPVSLFINLNSKNNNADKTLSAEIKRYVRSVDAALVNYTYNNNDSVNINNININNTNNVNFNFFSFLLYNKFNVLNFYKNLNLSFYKNFEFNIFYNKINNFNTLLNQQVISNIHHKQFLSSSSLKVKAIDSHRNKNTFFSNSNKLLLVFKSMTQDYNKQYANKKLINIEDSSLRFVEINNQYSIVQNHINQFSVFNNLTLEDFNTITLNSLYSMNLTINQWLNFNNYNFYNNNQLQWNNFLTFNFLTFNTKGFYLLNKKNINLNDNFQNIFFFFIINTTF